MSIRARQASRGTKYLGTNSQAFANETQATGWVAKQIAASRTEAERWDARGKPERAAKCRAEEAEILQDAKNFKRKLPTEAQILAACDCARRAWDKQMARRAAEEAELARYEGEGQGQGQ